MKRAVNNKLRSNAGESIAETLVALLISALALVMLAGAISAASRIVLNSRSKLDEYYDRNEKLVDLTADSNAGVVTITEVVSGADGSQTASGAAASINILYYENNAFKKNTVIAYRKKTGS